jgi:hypothetical protein
MTEPALPATGSVSTTVRASIEDVWTLMCDPSTPATYSSELQEASFKDGGGPARGVVIEGHNQRGDFKWSSESVVVDCDAPTLFRWATGDPGQPNATWSFAAADHDGIVTLTHTVVFHAGGFPLGPAIAKDPDHAHDIVNDRLADVMVNMQATVDGIAASIAHN